MTEKKVKLRLDIQRTYLLELKKVLWNYSVSAQGFFSYVIKSAATGDNRILEILEEIKLLDIKNKIANRKEEPDNQKHDIVTTDIDSIYNLIENSLKKENKRKLQSKKENQ